MESEAVESVGNDLSGKREVLILKQQALFWYAADERELVTRVGRGGRFKRAERRMCEVDMTRLAYKETTDIEQGSLRVFADARGTK